MRCSRVRENLTLYVLGELAPGDEAQVKAHLAQCPRCREELAAAKSLTALLDESFAGAAAFGPLTERIMGQVAATPLPGRVRRRDVPDVPVAEDEHLRRRTTAQLVAAAAVLLLAFVVWLAVPGRPRVVAQVDAEKLGYELTVYNDDLALVRDLRRLANLTAGVNQVRLADVPARIDPTSVAFRSRTDSQGTTVLDQNYEYDLATPEKMLQKYIDRQIEAVTRRRGDVHIGYLSGFDPGQLVLTEKPGEGQTQMVDRGALGSITFERLPEGLLTRPTLIWKVQARQAGLHEMVVSYLTGGTSWRCDYVFVQRPANKVDVKAWITIQNQSGASYPKARLKLMAGDVNIVRKEVEQRLLLLNALQDDKAEKEQGFEEKAFFEYHLYTLGRETDVADQSTKQIELTTAAGVGTTRQYVFTGGPKVGVYLKFKNSKDNGLGLALPKGVVRVMNEDPADGSLEFLGEDEIDHTAKDEEVKVLIGNAFDLVGERRVVSDRTAGRSRQATIEVKLRNHKPEPVTITVRETIPGDWQIAHNTHQYRKEDAHTVEFDVPVPAGKESVLRFTYTGTW